jgi:hypothetical protein
VSHLFPRAGAVLLALGLAAIAPASAQQAVKPPTQPAAPAAAPAGPQPTPQQMSLARDVVLYSGIARSFDVIVPQYLDQIGTNLTQTRPDLIRDLNTVREQIKPEFDKRVDEMVDSAARLYAARLTEQQLKDTGAFFKSPAGIAYVQAQPALMSDLLPAMQSWSRQIASDMMTRVRTEMKKKGHEL